MFPVQNKGPSLGASSIGVSIQFNLWNPVEDIELDKLIITCTIATKVSFNATMGSHGSNSSSSSPTNRSDENSNMGNYRSARSNFFLSLGQSSPEMRNRQVAQLIVILENPFIDGTQQFEEPIILDYTPNRSHLIKVINIQRNEENIPNMEQDQDVNMRLTEEEIMMWIGYETFESVAEETPENKDACCICKEEYVNGQKIGRLDYAHKFHMDCIKRWLVEKNVCPICRRMAIMPINESVDEDDYDINDEE